MSLKTKLLELFKYEPDKDGAQTFNIKSALNDNWDRIEAWAQSVKTTLAGLVPTSRKVNGKALSADVTLTGDDIAMGADDAESLRAAMAKRAVGSAVLPDNADLDTVTVSGMYRLATMELSWQAFSQMLVVHGGADTISQVIFAFSGGGVYVRTGNPTQVGGPGVWRNWEQLAVCTAPEVHDLPLADGWQIFGTSKNWYCKDQFNQVTVFFRLKSTGTNITEGVVMATLPEGYRPRSSVTMPGLITFDNYTRLPCHIDAGPSGALQLYVDGTTPSGRSVIELTCAGFHYPAK